MNDFLIQLAAGVIATLVGVWLGRRSGPAALGGNANVVIGGDGSVDQSDHSRRELSLHVHHTKVVSSVNAKEDEANGSDPLVIILVAGFAVMVLLAVGYLYLRDTALLAFRVASTSLLFFCLAFLVQSVVRRKFDRLLLIGAAVAAVAAVVTILNRGWLSNPGLAGDRVARVVDSGIRPGFGGMMDYLTVDEVVFVAFQCFGLLLTGLMLVFTAWICVALAGAARTGGRPPSAFLGGSVGRTVGLSASWVLIAALSMICCSGRLMAADSPLRFGDTHTASLELVASVKLSPTDRKANLLCVRVAGADVDPSELTVALERKIRRKQAAPHWQAVGTSRRFSENGTTCREVVLAPDRRRYRFSIQTDGHTVTSAALAVPSPPAN